jgi:hypothetical protein
MKTDTDGKPGLRIESAASVLLRDTIHRYFAQFALVLRRDRMAGVSAVTEFRNGYAGAIALVIAGGHASRDDIINAEIAKLREYVDRDLAHLRRGV